MDREIVELRSRVMELESLHGELAALKAVLAEVSNPEQRLAGSEIQDGDLLACPVVQIYTGASMAVVKAATSYQTVRDDKILRPTRWLAAFIIPFLVAAFYILYLRPSETAELFAWRIAPTMTAMMLAATYLGGIFYFTGVLFAKRWHHVKVGLLPITAFASILGVATILHWDRFTHGHISFITWTTLYWIAPFLVIGVWLHNRVTDPGTSDLDDADIPPAWRQAMGVVGVITLIVSLILFLQPTLMIAYWPWKLTPLTARVAAAMFALPGVVGLGVALDSRWSSARLILQAQACSIVFILIAVGRAWDEFDQSRPGTYLFVAGLCAILIGIVVLYLVMEARRKSGEMQVAD